MYIVSFLFFLYLYFLSMNLSELEGSECEFRSAE